MKPEYKRQTMNTEETIKEIKRGFRLQMNGVTSASMREKGVNGYLVWGIQLPQLKEIARNYTPDYDLAVALWKENVRECKILATLLMPRNMMTGDLVDLWMDQTPTQEIAEYAVFNLYQYVADASLFAYIWIASDNKLRQISGFNLLACLFKQGAEPVARDVNEFVDQAMVALKDDSSSVRHAATNSLTAFAQMGVMQQNIVDAAMKTL